jgi:hypothetical protein
MQQGRHPRGHANFKPQWEGIETGQHHCIHNCAHARATKDKCQANFDVTQKAVVKVDVNNEFDSAKQ